jgi:hypothetical protein
LTQFRGEWLDESKSKGTLLYESGAKYVGQLKNNKRHGEGTYTYPSLEELEREQANQPNFKIYGPDSLRLSFSGEWQDDMKVKGVIIYRDGGKYEGQLFDDECHGKGVYRYAGGDVY